MASEFPGVLCLMNKVGDILYYCCCQQIPEKIKNNNVLVHISVLSHFPAWDANANVNANHNKGTF